MTLPATPSSHTPSARRPGELGRVARYVLTGGPGAGKTVAAAEVARRLGPLVRHVPEAATAVYQELGRTWVGMTLNERRDAQTRMYRRQVEQERVALATAEADGIVALVLDRGTIDGAGYWPDGIDAFWPAMGTTYPRELARYDAVLWLETAAALGLYDHDASNSVRFEDAGQAIAAGETQARLWADHPHLLRIPARTDFNEKLAAVEAALRGLMARV